MINYESDKSQQQQLTETTSNRDSILPRQSELLNRTLRSQTQQLQQLNFKQQQQPDQRFNYTVIIRNRVFKLTYDQICFDQPNLFTSSFLGSFHESTSRSLNIPDRSIINFEIIYEYLSGYAILPLNQSNHVTPNNSKIDKTNSELRIDLRNFLSDCEYYGLMNLRDELTLPRVEECLSSRYRVKRSIRFDDLVMNSGSGGQWSQDGLLDLEPGSKDSRSSQGVPTHLLVYLTKVNLKIDLTVRGRGDCPQTSFSIELPPYAAILSDRGLRFREDGSNDLVTDLIESLYSTPLDLNESSFEGTFGDLANWMNYFLIRFGGNNQMAHNSTYPQFFFIKNKNKRGEEIVNEKLNEILPSLAENLRMRSSQGQKVLRLSTSFWATSMSIIIVPGPVRTTSKGTDDDNDGVGGYLVAKLLNCSLTTGLFRRKKTKALVVI
ncbi:hypothetical protein BY996DRAFT_4578120 [Phakopsora pachyrhizi]|uniref:BTB domain-containing protein n=1 Tax=Phakopsora pachyrhizi TaxID=170000 RepID=A0AAV0BLY8_PHAPC|nr:hypothetical protein BY996DRAFT_4578120 [Phakopsora pachyrhizi]CAH7687340.1 hypothetical protein PPACK8108_LOCUS22114 [Phakopsora pachyrhizi]